MSAKALAPAAFFVAKVLDTDTVNTVACKQETSQKEYLYPNFEKVNAFTSGSCEFILNASIDCVLAYTSIFSDQPGLRPLHLKLFLMLMENCLRT